jgi:uncharacterized protein
MSASLLDVNVLVALVWPAHEFHSAVQEWFARNAEHGWATCPFTQVALVRILSNPAFSRDAVTPPEAVKILSANLEHPCHRFWGDEVGFAELVRPLRSRLVGHRQVGDAYLLGLAIHRDGRLATLDQGVLALLPPGSSDRGRVELISS